MKKNILILLLVLLLGIICLFLKNNSNTNPSTKIETLEIKGEISKNNVKKTEDNESIATKNKIIVKKNIENNMSDEVLLKSIKDLIANRGHKEFDDFFSIDTYEDTTGNIEGSYKVGMLEEVFEHDQLDLPFFDTYQATVTHKSIDPSGYMQVDANLEGDEDGYLGLVENKQSKVLSGVLYDYQGGVEYHIEGKNGKFRIFPIKEDSYIHDDDVMTIIDKKSTES